ncbi:MAG: TRAP transporter large permease subunit, partial [candidate division WOR-3 bacterium]
GAVYLLMGGVNGLTQLTVSIFDSLTKFNLTAIPFFILMGEVLYHAGLVSKALDVFSKWVGAIPGRLSIVTFLIGGLFGALSGATVASTAVLASLMVPEMMRRHYGKEMILGPIMASGALDMIIPPSALTVLLGTIAEVSIGRLLINAIIPGYLLLGIYVGFVVIRCWLNPSLAPKYEVSGIALREKIWLSLRDLLPLGIVIFVALGLMMLGVATPTEAAALASLIAFILAAAYRSLSLKVIRQSVFSSLQVTVMILTIIAASAAFSQVLAFSGASRGMLDLVLGAAVDPFWILIIMLAIVTLLGCFIEQVSIMMITLPIFMPIVKAIGLDPVWVCILILLCLSIGQLSPPFGLALFVMKAASPPEITMKDIYQAAWPYCLLDMVGVALIIAFPSLATWFKGT